MRNSNEFVRAWRRIRAMRQIIVSYMILQRVTLRLYNATWNDFYSNSFRPDGKLNTSFMKISSLHPTPLPSIHLRLLVLPLFLFLPANMPTHYFVEIKLHHLHWKKIKTKWCSGYDPLQLVTIEKQFCSLMLHSSYIAIIYVLVHLQRLKSARD